MNQESKKILIDLDLSRRVVSTTPRVKLEAERELKLTQNICRSSKILFRRSKFTDRGQIIYLQRGQYFATYRLLGALWGCSLKASRYQLQKWCKSNLIKTSVVKDSKSFDLGLVINYNPVFLEKNWGMRQTTKNRHSQIGNPRQGAPLSVKNINRKTTKEVVFLKDIEFGRRVVGKLKALGLSCSEIDKLYLNYSIDELLDYLRLLKLSNKVTNPKAFLKAALKSKYSLRVVENYRQSKKVKILENKKIKEAEREKQRLENEQIAQEMIRVNAKQAREIKIKTWLQNQANRIKYEQEVLNIVEQVESNKDIKPSIETITKRLLTRSDYKYFKEMYDQKVNQATKESIQKLEEEYTKMYVDIVWAGELTAENIGEFLQQKNRKIIEIKTLDKHSETLLKIAVIQEVPSLKLRLETWIDNQIEQYTNQQTTTTVDQALATTSQANSWGIGESDPKGLVPHELACSLQIQLPKLAVLAVN